MTLTVRMESGLQAFSGRFNMFRRQRRSSGTKWGLIGAGIAAGATLIPLIPIIRRRAFSVTTILKKDHRIVIGLIGTLEMTPRGNWRVRRTLMDQIRSQLLIHTQAEEEVVYPVLRNMLIGVGESKVSEAYREHQVVRDLLNDLTTIDPATDAFDNKVEDLKSKIQHHVDEEEGEMFEILRSHLSQDQLQQMGERVHDRKKLLKGKMAA